MLEILGRGSLVAESWSAGHPVLGYTGPCTPMSIIGLSSDSLSLCLSLSHVGVTEMDCPSWGSLNWHQHEMVTQCKALSFAVETGEAWESWGLAGGGRKKGMPLHNHSDCAYQLWLCFGMLQSLEPELHSHLRPQSLKDKGWPSSSQATDLGGEQRKVWQVPKCHT